MPRIFPDGCLHLFSTFFLAAEAVDRPISQHRQHVPACAWSVLWELLPGRKEEKEE